MLQIRRLEKMLDGRSMLSIDALDIEAGEIVAVTGPTGSGKTLLIHLLAGALVPSGGGILLDGETISPEARKARQHIRVYASREGMRRSDTMRGREVEK